MSEQKEMRAPPVEIVRQELTRMSDQFKMVLPPNLSVDRFIRVAMTAIQSTPDLLNTSRQSLIGELLKCAKDGLIPDGREAAITIYRTKNGQVAQYMPMVGGILKKVRNSGELLNMHPEVVWSRDSFRYWIDDDGPHIMHEPFMDGARGEPVKVYVVTNTKSEGRYIDVLTKEDVAAVKNNSKARDFGPWSGDFELEMWKKTAIRRQSKRLPMSTDLDDVIRRDDDLTELAAKAPDAPALKAQSVAAIAEPKAPDVNPEPKEAVKSEPKPATKTVINHATGQPHEVPLSADLPPKQPNVQAGPAPAGDIPDRNTLGQQIQTAFRRLGFKPLEAADWVLKKTGKKTQDLLDIEMFHVHEILIEMAIEKGVQI